MRPSPMILAAIALATAPPAALAAQVPTPADHSASTWVPRADSPTGMT